MQSGRLAGPLASRLAMAFASGRGGPHAKIRACRADRLHFRRAETIVLRGRYTGQITLQSYMVLLLAGSKPPTHHSLAKTANEDLKPPSPILFSLDARTLLCTVWFSMCVLLPSFETNKYRHTRKLHQKPRPWNPFKLQEPSL